MRWRHRSNAAGDIGGRGKTGGAKGGAGSSRGHRAGRGRADHPPPDPASARGPVPDRGGLRRLADACWTRSATGTGCRSRRYADSRRSGRGARSRRRLRPQQRRVPRRLHHRRGATRQARPGREADVPDPGRGGGDHPRPRRGRRAGDGRLHAPLRARPSCRPSRRSRGLGRSTTPASATSSAATGSSSSSRASSCASTTSPSERSDDRADRADRLVREAIGEAPPEHRRRLPLAARAEQPRSLGDAGAARDAAAGRLRAAVERRQLPDACSSRTTATTPLSRRGSTSSAASTPTSRSTATPSRCASSTTRPTSATCRRRWCPRDDRRRVRAARRRPTFKDPYTHEIEYFHEVVTGRSRRRRPRRTSWTTSGCSARSST